MSADGQRKAYRYTCNMIRPQIYSEKTLMESVVDFFSDVVPQAYSNTQRVEDKEKIQWVRFENCDCNDISKNPDLYRSDTKGLPLLLILGYSNGVQIWHVTSNGEAQELMSIRQGPVRIFRILPIPDNVLGYPDAFVNKRPLAVMCDSSSAGQPYCGIKFVSLKTGDEVHSVNYKTLPVQTIECNKRFLAIVFLEKICVYDACQFKQLFWVTSCFPCPGPTVNPVALSSRWLAYADKRLVAMHQSCGGMSGDGSQSYAATVISAAKGAFKGMSMFGEAIVNSVTGCKTPGVKKQPDIVHLDNGNRPGIVTVVDIQNVHNDHFNVNEDNEGSGLIAHFHAHANEPVSNMAFDSTGTLLVTACKLGHNFHVFRLMAHPSTSALGAVHHLYTLHRGDTTAKVIDISFNHDSRWVTVSTHRGTTHIFPITPYGGPINVRTHCQPHIVNRASRFHKSAGLEDIQSSPMGRRSPILSTSPSSSGQYDRYPTLIQQNTLNNNMGNPRLPPYPHPATVYPLFQIKQPLGVALNPGGNKNMSPSHSPTGLDNMYCVCAKFCSPRLCVIGSPKLDVDRRESSRRAVDSLFIMTQSGSLVEYVLEPRARAVLDKVTEDCTLDLAVTGRMHWNLQRLKASQELRPPLPSNSPVILSNEAVTSQIPTAADLCDHIGLTRQDSKDSLSSDHSNKDDDEQWLSQVEIITHAGPHRRLWMGPQFSFKTYQENTTVLCSSSSALLSQSPETNLHAMDITGEDGDLESLKVSPARSNPVTMPTTRPAYRRLSGSDSSPSPGLGQITPLMIEAGSFDQSPHLLDVYSNWTESTVEKQPRGGDDQEEDRLKQTLADAMVESPCKDIEKLTLRQDVSRTSVTNGKGKKKGKEEKERKKQLEKAQKKTAETSTSAAVAAAASEPRKASSKELQKTEEKKSSQTDLSKPSKKSSSQKDIKGKTSEVARNQEPKGECVKQKTPPLAEESKTNSKAKEEAKAADAPEEKSGETSSRGAMEKEKPQRKEKEKTPSKEEVLPEVSKKVTGKKGKQGSGKKSKTSKAEKPKSAGVRFADEEESVTDSKGSKEKDSACLTPDATSNEKQAKSSSSCADANEQIDKCKPETNSEEEISIECNIEEELSINETHYGSQSDKESLESKEAPSSGVPASSNIANTNKSCSTSVEKNLEQAAVEEISESSISKKEDSSIELVASNLDNKNCQKSNLKKANATEGKPASLTKSARKSLECSLVETVEVEGHFQTAKEDKASNSVKDCIEASTFKTIEDISDELQKMDVANETEQHDDMEDRNVHVEQAGIEIVSLETVDTKQEPIKSSSLETVGSKHDQSDTMLKSTVTVTNTDITETAKKDEAPSGKEKKKKRKNGKKTQESQKTEEKNDIEEQRKKKEETGDHGVKLEEVQDKGHTHPHDDYKTDKKQTSKEQTDSKEEVVSKKSKRKDRNLSEQKEDVRNHEDMDKDAVVDSGALVPAATTLSIDEADVKSDLKVNFNVNDIEADSIDLLNANTIPSETSTVVSSKSESQTADWDFPSLPEKVADDNEGMFVVKSKKSRKKKSKMEESEYFDTSESLKDVLDEPVPESAPSSTEVVSTPEILSNEHKPDISHGANKEVCEQSVTESKSVEAPVTSVRNPEPSMNEDDMFVVKSKRKKKKKKNQMEESVYEDKQMENLETSVYVEAPGLAVSLYADTVPDSTDKTVGSLQSNSTKTKESPESISTEDSTDEKGTLNSVETSSNHRIQTVQELKEIPQIYEPSSWETEAIYPGDKDPIEETLDEQSSADIVSAIEEASAASGTDNSVETPLTNSSERSSEERESETKVETKSDRSSEEKESAARPQPMKTDASKNKKKKKKNKK